MAGPIDPPAKLESLRAVQSMNFQRRSSSLTIIAVTVL
jgi:hypothetical protein